MFKTWFYTNIYNVYTNYCLILQIFKVWAVVYLSYCITSVLFVMLWVDECLQAVVIHLLSVYISITPVKVIQLTFSYFLSFLLLPSLTTFDLYSIFTFFLLLIFVYFIMLKNQHVWEDIYYLRNQRWRRFCWWCWWYAFVVIDRFELWYIHVNIPYLLLSGLTYWFTTVNQ